LIRCLCVVGVGLIGGSLARALKAAGAVTEVVGCGRNENSLRRALELGVIDRYEREPGRAVAGADVVLLAVPLGAMRVVMERMRGQLDPDTVVTDAGSAKACVLADARAVFGRVPETLVPGHPIAGTERSGVEASFAELFRGRRVILTPLADTSRRACALVTRMWSLTGAEVVEMGVAHHDQVLAATSHLPHLLAYSLVDTLARLDDHTEIFRFAAGGFRDFTRIASSDPVMWRDICVANREPLLQALEAFGHDLEKLAAAVREADGEAIQALFSRAKRARDNLYRE
jgi:prephenate dehydrogenase